MNFQDHEFSYSWTENNQWRMPEDEQLFRGEFPHVNEFVTRALALTSSREVCIQAGACIGLVPIRYAQEFEEVITFEPLPISYQCLTENIQRCKTTNITTHHTAIGLKGTKITMKYPKPPHLGRSYGAHCVVETQNGVLVISIDDIDLNGKRVDLIQLDVEGYEFRCLQSAANVIEEFKPIVVIEQRMLRQMNDYKVKVNDAQNWLLQRGYRVADKFRGDLMLAPK